MNLKIIPIKQNIKEKDFPSHIKKLGYKCKKVSSSNIYFIQKKLGQKFEMSKGIPDFFIYNKFEKFLCEFKSLNDSLRKHQVLWILNHPEIPLVLAWVVQDEKVKNNLLKIDSPFEKNIILEKINLSWYYKWKFLRNYLIKNDILIKNKSIFVNRIGVYEGYIPDEVLNYWDEIDKKLIKNGDKSVEIYTLEKEKEIKNEIKNSQK
jgi:hypothetical protein